MRRRYILAPSFLLAMLVAMLAVFGCTEKPTAPVFNNPLDPLGPENGDPFHISASYLSGKVYVSWDKLEFEAVEGYTILHTTTPGGSYSQAGTVGPTVGSFFHEDFLPNSENYYMVRATNIDGIGTSTSSVAQAFIVPPPTLVIGDTTYVRGVDINLTLLTAIGDSAQVDSLPDFSSGLPAISLAGTENENNLLEVVLPWTFGPVPTNGSYLHLYLRVYTGGQISAVEHDSIKVDFTPSFRLRGGGEIVATFTPELEMIGDGIARMRFALSAEGLGAAVFSDYTPTTSSPDLGLQLEAKEIFGEFESEFGFSDTTSIMVQPDNLETIDLKINAGNTSTSDSLLSILATVGATKMRFGLNGSVGPLWIDYSPSYAYRLQDPCGDGPRIIISAQYANAWGVSAILSDTLTWIPPAALQVFFDVPDTLVGNQSFSLEGSATSATCGAALSAVEIDTGEGWQVATGLSAWNHLWDVPTVPVDSTFTIRGLAIAGTDSMISETTIVITP